MEKIAIAENLKRLRIYQELTQQKLAEQCSIKYSSYRNYEAGKTIPKVDTLINLARGLNVPLQELLAPVQPLTHIRFRATKKMRVREKVIADVSRWLNNFNYLESILDMKQDNILDKFSNNGYNDLKELAQDVRKLFGLEPDEIIHDICALLESKGIKILQINIDSDDFFGLSVAKDSEGPAVIVNVNKKTPVERWIFTAAHELGHLILHKDSFDFKQEKEDKEQENEASRFASYFLMPDRMFRKKWEESSGSSLYHRIVHVKRIFKVSYKTIIYRLQDNYNYDKQRLHMMFNNEYRILHNKVLRFKTEPYSIAESRNSRELRYDFIESRLKKLVRIAVESEKISFSRGAEILNISINDFRQLAENWI